MLRDWQGAVGSTSAFVAARMTSFCLIASHSVNVFVNCPATCDSESVEAFGVRIDNVMAVSVESWPYLFCPDT